MASGGKRLSQPKQRSTAQRCGNRTKPFFASEQLDCLQLDPFVARCLRRLLAGISLIGERHLDRLAVAC
jgi:hypothetical protein